MTKQFLVFLMVGGLQYSIDVAVFSGLTLLISTEFANVTSRAVAALSGYVLNGKVTFKTPQKDPVHSASFQRFLMVWALMTLISTGLITLITSHYQLAWEASIALKLTVEMVLVILSFTLQKLYVFR